MTRIINIYNQKQLGDHAHPNYTSDCIATLQWDLHIPTIITGDWNICHPRWDNGVQSACPRTHETLKWIKGNGFTLCNGPFMPTREDSMGHASVINLTFKNPAANGSNVLRKHYVDTMIGSLSDHHALVLQVGDPNHIVTNPATNNLNWKHADEEDFTKTLRDLLEEEEPQYNHIVSETLNYDKQSAMPEELDRATEFIQQLLEKTARKSVPECRICEKSKPWWTPELTKAYSNL